MTRSDFDHLRQLGEQVQSQKREKFSFKKLFFSLIYILKKKASVIQHYFFSYLKNAYSFIEKKIPLVKSFVKQKINLWINSTNKSVKKKQIVDDSSCVLVEHQKQWMNTSIIIRRRKKRPIGNQDDSTIPVPPSAAAAYYFHCIDTKEAEYKTRFKPMSSIWDFNISSDQSFFSKLKEMLRYKR
ncbi:MAG: hypothetical protein KGY50_05600 [Candidatus Thermoplasmatota archaeon]|nr:hypothetical protein [Candidatus Thermoplasmatota archaeon]